MMRPFDDEPGGDLLSEEEVEELAQLAKGPKVFRGESISDELQLIWALSDAPGGPDDWSRLQAHVRGVEETSKRPMSRRWRYTVPIAAAAAFAGVVAGQLFEPISGTLPWRQPPAVVISVPSGDRASLELVPGLEVHLNAATTLTYTPSRAGVLDLTLEGEAFFDVSSTAERSLRVKTAAGIIRNIGTKFNVYARDGRVSVAVAEGQIELTAAERTVLVQHGQEALALLGQVPTTPRPANLSVHLGWREGTVSAFAEPLHKVIREIERRYAVSIEVADDLRDQRVTFVLHSSSASAAMAAICAAIEGATCKRKAGYWQIHSQP